MKRWNTTMSKEIDSPPIDEFLNEIIAVCEKHGISISHEDGHGSFQIENFDKFFVDWILNAQDARK